MFSSFCLQNNQHSKSAQPDYKADKDLFRNLHRGDRDKFLTTSLAKIESGTERGTSKKKGKLL